MSKLKVTTIANVADSESTDVTNVINGSAKAWVNFDGTFGSSPFTVANGGIRAAFNVSSVVDNGTGDYTVNFTTAMPDASYNMVGSSAAGATANFASNRIIGINADVGGVGSSAPTASACRIASIYGTETKQDAVWIQASFFR